MSPRGIIAATLGVFAAPIPVYAAEHAIILVYHHVSEDTPRSTSVTPSVFESHLDYLTEHDYEVLALETLIQAIVNDEALPPRAVALTFDDAYDSIHGQALPRLERRGWPFTVFAATDGIDQGFADLMTWDQLRDIENRGGTIANHTSDHRHLIRRNDGESRAAWLARTRANIEAAQARLDAELEKPLRYLAYPYGEFDTDIEALAREMGYVAFGQQSGPVGHGSDLGQLPRFPIATGYDDLDSLAEKLRTRPLPVTVLGPKSRLLAPRAAAPDLRLTLADGPFRREAMQCFVAGQEPATISWQGDTATIRAREPLGPGRSKYNCTAPSSEGSGVFFWYSHLWIEPREDGSWYSN